jgi:hypothetical protein
MFCIGRRWPDDIDAVALRRDKGFQALSNQLAKQVSQPSWSDRLSSWRDDCCCFEDMQQAKIKMRALVTAAPRRSGRLLRLDGVTNIPGTLSNAGQ